MAKIKGIAFRNQNKVIINAPEKIVPNEKMDIDLPGYAWDLLPKKNILNNHNLFDWLSFTLAPAPFVIYIHIYIYIYIYWL